MGEQGYEGTSTRDIARAAGVSVAALYYHFPSKLDLLRQFVHEAHDVVLGRLQREIAAAGDDPRAQLDAAVSTIIGSNLHTEWAQGAAQVAWRELDRLEAKDRALVRQKRDALVACIASVITRGARAGVFATNGAAEAADAVLRLCMSTIDTDRQSARALADTIALYQRFALSLADTPVPPRRKRSRSR
jgi:AcrR family transcriptional regulator